ncbi:Ribosomal protein L15, bacterial-type [Corchorus capsularis]|uniref:Ribosomal protein L15, bacterial-type n=1 Tax=Corchorus capsularis TaxID=210143 RepID=A0A1R3I6G5_COCAP|nr:Ribosomal protein L15, bacterial-type [Corchorus capsularis]
MADAVQLQQQYIPVVHSKKSQSLDPWRSKPQIALLGESIRGPETVKSGSNSLDFLCFLPLSSFGIRAYSLLSLNDLRDNVPRKQKTRKGRGIGSGKGKTAGRGHKGQRARGNGKLGFEGGQTPMRRRLPKRGFKNPFSLTFQPVGLGKIAKLINAGKIDSHELITMKTLKDAGAIGKQIEDGVRLMGRGSEQIKWPIHLEVSRVTVRAKEAVEAAGGSVRRVHYNKLGFRALLKPEWFEKKGRLLPKPARPPPKLKDKVDSIGRLPAPTKPIPFFTEEELVSSPA